MEPWVGPEGLNPRCRYLHPNPLWSTLVPEMPTDARFNTTITHLRDGLPHLVHWLQCLHDENQAARVDRGRRPLSLKKRRSGRGSP